MALPTHKVSIFKQLGAEEWSNDYLLNVTGMEEGATVADSLVTFERNLHSSSINFMYYRLATMTEGDRVYRHTPLNVPGLAPAQGVAGLPLYCTMRMDMATEDSDPCRKYFRLPIDEGSQENGKFIPAAITGFMTVITTYFINSIAIDNVVSGKGNVVTGASVHPMVQMRQLHRRKRKKILVGGVLV